MTNIDKVLNITENPAAFVSHGKARIGAIENNGAIVTTIRDIVGIICGYKGQKDYWIYWVQTHTLTHYTTLQVSEARKPHTDRLSHTNTGVESINVESEDRNKFLRLAAQANETIEKELKNQTKNKILCAGKIYEIDIHGIGKISVMGNNEDEAWDLLRSRSTTTEQSEQYNFLSL